MLIHLLDLADSIQEQNLENINTSTFRQSREIDPASRAHDPGLGKASVQLFLCPTSAPLCQPSLVAVLQPVPQPLGQRGVAAGT